MVTFIPLTRMVSLISGDLARHRRRQPSGVFLELGIGKTKLEERQFAMAAANN